VHQVDDVAADGAVVSPSLSNATLSPPVPATKLPQSSLATTAATTKTASPPPIRSVYVLCPSPFLEVEEFVEASIKAYNLRLVRVSGSMRVALQAYLDTEEGEGVEAVLVGTRRNDPHGGKSLLFLRALSFFSLPLVLYRNFSFAFGTSSNIAAISEMDSY
jgi:3'-phosphoadenosine 5'-phosphosulfate sulfotransferase (PAPS reductase)/FAD synthetase